MTFTDKQKFFIMLAAKAVIGAAAPLTGAMTQAGGIVVPGAGVLILSAVFGVVAAATELLSFVKGPSA